MYRWKVETFSFLRHYGALLLGVLRQSMYRWRLSLTIVQVPQSGVYLNYGPFLGDLLSKHATGGQVKLTYLQQRFPHHSNYFNVCYLVSSALPPHASVLVEWAKKHGVVTVLNQNGVAYPAWTEDYDRINEELRALVSSVDFVVYQSGFCRTGVKKWLGEPDVPSAIHYNCVDLDRFKPVKRNYSGNSIHLLVAGTHYQRERVTIPIMVVKSLIAKGWDVKLTVAGALSWDSSELEIRTLIAKLGLRERINLIGPYPNDEAQLILQKTDILLHLKYNDPCPNVVIEALALGTPVIGSDSGGMRELVGNHAGVLIPVPHSWSTMHYPNPQDVDDAVLLIMQSINTFRNDSRKRAVELFDLSSWIRAHEDIFSMLIKKM